MSKLLQLEARGHVSPAQRRAGELWAEDWHAALGGPVAGRAYASRLRCAGAPPGLDMAAVKRQRWRRAAARLGPLRPICFAVAIEGRDASEIAAELGETPRAVLPMLRRGLDELAEFYQPPVPAALLREAAS